MSGQTMTNHGTYVSHNCAQSPNIFPLYEFHEAYTHICTRQIPKKIALKVLLAKWYGF